MAFVSPPSGGDAKEMGEDMLKLHTWKSSVILLALLTSNAFAANRGSLHVSSPEDVAGEHLAAGDYTVRWEGSGPTVQLTILRGEKVAATVTAHVKPLEHASDGDSVVIEKDKDGKPVLSQIYFGGKKIALEIKSPSEGTTANSGN